jgi:hypothetical protein
MCYTSTGSSIKPLDIGDIEGFLFGHIWESSRPGPRVVEEWPRVGFDGAGGGLGEREKMNK